MALLEGIAALVAKVASASTVAQATAGLGIAVAGVTGAGAAGVLPGPVQDTVAGAVEAVTPFQLPHSTDTSGRPRTAPEVHDDAPAAVVPTTSIVVPSPAAPTTEAAERETEVEHGVETADGTHQHRGGRTTATPASSDDADETTEAPEVEDDHGGTGDSGSVGDDSRHGGGSGSDSGNDDASGHGGD